MFVVIFAANIQIDFQSFPIHVHILQEEFERLFIDDGTEKGSGPAGGWKDENHEKGKCEN